MRYLVSRQAGKLLELLHGHYDRVQSLKKNQAKPSLENRKTSQSWDKLLIISPRRTSRNAKSICESKYRSYCQDHIASKSQAGIPMGRAWVPKLIAVPQASHEIFSSSCVRESCSWSHFLCWRAYITASAVWVARRRKGNLITLCSCCAPAPRAIIPIQEILRQAACLTPSPMDTTFLITGASVQATATPAVAAPAAGRTFRRTAGETEVKARVAGLAAIFTWKYWTA